MGSALPGSSANGWMLLWIGGVRLRGGRCWRGSRAEVDGDPWTACSASYRTRARLSEVLEDA